MPPLLPRIVALAVGGLLSMSTATSVARAATSEAPLTLAETLRLVRERGSLVAESNAELRVAEAGVDVARVRRNPKLNVDAENLGGTGAYRDGALRETTTSVSLPLEIGGQRGARIRVAEADRTVAQLGADVTQSEATFRATQLFVGAVASGRRLALARERYQLAEAAVGVARSRVRAGKASPLEEQRAEVMRLNAEVAVGSAHRATDLALSNLARLIGHSKIASLEAPWFDRPDSDGAGAGSTPAPIALAGAQVHAAQARVDAAKRARIPDLTIMAGTRRFAEVDVHSTVIGISLDLPLFDTGRAVVAKARADLNLAEARQRTAQLDYEQGVGAAEVELANARATAASATGTALAAAEEAARIARVGYEAGKFSQLDLIEAERVLAETRAQAIEALETLHIASARLLRLQGRSDPLFKDRP